MYGYKAMSPFYHLFTVLYSNKICKHYNKKHLDVK